ncbi:MAG: DNA polymerase domain-containing protein [Bacteroidota bacterium]|nr:DNA polymerase domain-containing protein [Bacteroidota bacterium]
MNPILFGADDETNIVAVHAHSNSLVRIYKRAGDLVEYRDEEFFPFFHLSDKRFIENFPDKFWIKKLSGNNFYQYLCAFPSVPILWDAVNYALRKLTKEFKTNYNSHQETEHIFLRPDMNTQYLMQSGKTLFKEMKFTDLHRMQLDIETYSKEYRFSRADKKDDRIILISLSDNKGFETVLGGKNISEKKLLQQCIRIITEKNPDILEGHNIFNFDLPYILRRCEIQGMEFSIGRDGSAPSGFKSRTSFAENSVEYTSYEVAGRHIIDTWLLVQSFDITKRNMESHGLKYAAKYFGLAAPDRTYIPGEKISWYWDNDPETLKKYALDDVIETRGLSEKLSGSTFYLTQMLPFNFGTIAKLGAAAKIESIFLREYIRQKQSIPKPQKGTQTSGGYTDIFYTGVFGPIVHADVESLYPSIMLAKKLRPITDDLDVFQSALEFLTTMRLDAKRSLKQTTNEQEYSTLDAMQSSFKILINSFYGYLGYGKGLFNDYTQADIVTTTGQDLLKKLIREIGAHNGTVIEVDTDGIYFIPPDNVGGEESERKFIEHLSETLPDGINLGFNGKFKRMLSYKKKNYALLDYRDKITIKGSSLISRAMEKFGRSYVQQCIDCLLNDRIQDLHNLYIELEKTIREHGLDIADFAKTETLKDSLAEYKRDIADEKRNRTAAYELAINSVRTHKQGSRIQYYITGSEANVKGFENAKEAYQWDVNFPDENTAYYLKRLDEFSNKFEVFFDERDFKTIFSTEDLFGFNPKAIVVINRKEKTVDLDEEREDIYSIEFDDGIGDEQK